MRTFIHAILAVLLFASSCARTENNSVKTSVEIGSYTNSVAVIEQKVQQMIANADFDEHFYFSDDKEFESQDPNAYWLMNRMMQMVQMVETADDCWAWMLAMNQSVEEYNSRLGRKIGSVDAACLAIEELIDIYHSGNQPELNSASYVESILAHYKVVYAYYEFIEDINDYKEDSDWDLQMKALYFREFKEWFDLNNAVDGIMTFYTYAAARYSALPMDLNGTFEIWSKSRFEELVVESNIISSYDWKPFSSDANTVSSKKFDQLLSYFKGKTGDYDVEQNELTDENDYLHNFAQMLIYYETALINWREIREQIAQMLPKNKQKSYREITKQMHTRLYDDLENLKQMRY